MRHLGQGQFVFNDFCFPPLKRIIGVLFGQKVKNPCPGLKRKMKMFCLEDAAPDHG
jgi:hypothetical protein